MSSNSGTICCSRVKINVPHRISHHHHHHVLVLKVLTQNFFFFNSFYNSWKISPTTLSVMCGIYISCRCLCYLPNIFISLLHLWQWELQLRFQSPLKCVVIIYSWLSPSWAFIVTEDYIFSRCFGVSHYSFVTSSFISCGLKLTKSLNPNKNLRLRYKLYISKDLHSFYWTCTRLFDHGNNCID